MNSAYIIDRVFNVHEVKENLNLIKILKCHIYIYIYIYIYVCRERMEYSVRKNSKYFTKMIKDMNWIQNNYI